jgi:hypothetical protein
MKLPWKQHYLHVPERISQKLRTIPKPDVVVGCVAKLSAEAIKAGTYQHMQISLGPNGPEYSNLVVPPRAIGKYSAMNIDGKVVIRKDLPMVTKTYSWDTPNWGDSWNGTHEVSIDREVYQRDFVPPQELAIKIELLGEEPGPADERRFVFKFVVDEVLDKKSRKFGDALLFAVNLLQENVGVADVFPADAKVEEYLKTVYVDWEILPPGERDDNIAKILSGFRAPTEEDRKKVIDRYDTLAKLKPIAFISGRSGFRRYFGAQFGKDLVAFENLEYGNALYVMFDKWETLSQRSRLDLLKGDRKGFVRIVHEKGWKKKLTSVMAESR